MINSLDFLKIDKDLKFKKNIKIVIVKTLWNADIVNNIELEYKKTLLDFGIKNVITIEAPGAIEIPFIIKKIYEANKNKKDSLNKISAFIAIGCVIKGDTPHFEYVCKNITYSIATLNITINVPTIMGVLTVNNKEQALERINKINNKGKEFALTTIKMVQLNNIKI